MTTYTPVCVIKMSYSSEFVLPLDEACTLMTILSKSEKYTVSWENSDRKIKIEPIPVGATMELLSPGEYAGAKIG